MKLPPRVTESLTVYLRGQQLDYGKLMEVSSVVEVEDAGLAVERANPQQLSALRAAAGRLRIGLPAKEAARPMSSSIARLPRRPPTSSSKC